MFNWVWDLLYGISKSIYSIIDGLLSCANMLCGIEPVRYQNVEMDFMTFLLRNRNIYFGFVSAVIIGVILVFIFAVFAMIRSMSSEKDNLTPRQITVKVGKTLLTFIFIPAAMVVLIYLTNVLMRSLYQATLGGSPDGLGRFLAGAFGMDARHDGVSETFYLSESFKYTSTSSVKDFVNLKDYDFFFSWIGGIAILISLASALLMFVDRAISIVILFVICPISMSTAVIDDGQRFKLWRDQFLVKFLTGYGCIIGINLYALVIGAITSDNLVFFDNYYLNNLMKIAIMVGGAVSMNRLMALIGNLISQGAGSNELRDNAIATAQMRGIGMRALSAAGSILKSPFTATRGAMNFFKDTQQHGLGSAVAQRFGFKTDRDYGKMSLAQKKQTRENLVEGEKYKRSLNGPGNQGGQSNVKNVIEGQKNNNNQGGQNNANKGNANNNIGNKMIEKNVLNNQNNNADKK